MAIGAPMTSARIASGIGSATTTDPIAITNANFTIKAMAMNGSASSFSGSIIIRSYKADSNDPLFNSLKQQIAQAGGAGEAGLAAGTIAPSAAAGGPRGRPGGAAP